MTAVHFTTVPCEPNTANGDMETHFFCDIRLCSINIVYARLKFLELFRAVFFFFFFLAGGGGEGGGLLR